MQYSKKNIFCLLLSISGLSTELFAIKAIKTKAEFNAAISETSGNVLVKFFAPWCPPCKTLGKILNTDIIPKYQDKVTFLEVNFDVCGSVAQKYGIISLPTMLFFKDGKKIHKIIGGISAQELSKEIDTRFNF